MRYALLEEQRLAAARRPALDVITHSPEQTQRFGSMIGRTLQPGDLVLLSGQIGSGKTIFVQGIAQGLGVESDVLSPTFTIVMEHEGRSADGQTVKLYHVDLYRLPESDPDEIIGFGFEEYFDDERGIIVIEWPERARPVLPDEYLVVEVEAIADTKRSIRLTPYGDRYEEITGQIREEVSGSRG